MERRPELAPALARSDARSRQARRTGFTLIEIMAVVLIMGLLIGIVGVNVIGNIDTGRRTRAMADLSGIETALERYRMDNARYPTTDQGLISLIDAPTIAPEPRNYQNGGYLRGKKIPEDPWGNPYQFLSPGQLNPEYDLWSLGADGAPGGEGTDGDIWPESLASD